MGERHEFWARVEEGLRLEDNFAFFFTDYFMPMYRKIQNTWEKVTDDEMVEGALGFALEQWVEDENVSFTLAITEPSQAGDSTRETADGLFLRLVRGLGGLPRGATLYHTVDNGWTLYTKDGGGLYEAGERIKFVHTGSLLEHLSGDSTLSPEEPCAICGHRSAEHRNSWGHAFVPSSAPSSPGEGAREALEQLDGLESFLDGSVAYEGVWFGDTGPEGGHFWWRSAMLHPICEMLRTRLTHPLHEPQAAVAVYGNRHFPRLHYHAGIKELPGMVRVELSDGTHRDYAPEALGGGGT